MYAELPFLPLQSSEEDQSDLAGQGFLCLLSELRIILLQDSVILLEEFPDHLIWQDPLFVRKDYRTFAQEVRESLLVMKEPDELCLRQIIPDIASRLNISQQSIVQSVNLQGSCTFRMVELLAAQMEDLFAGWVSITI